MILTYYLPDHGEKPDDAVLLPGATETKPRYFAQEAAEYCQNERDGWEWDWPTTFVVLADGLEAGRFTVAREMVPEFYAVEVRDPKSF